MPEYPQPLAQLLINLSNLGGALVVQGPARRPDVHRLNQDGSAITLSVRIAIASSAVASASPVAVRAANDNAEG